MSDLDVLVVGGGPAGLTAALHAARGGLRVAVVEEHAELGGQYFKRRHPVVAARHGDYRPAGTRLVAEVRQAGVECLTEHLVWGVADDGAALLVTGPDNTSRELRARFTILATGAYERVLPFPGWQLPGVVTAGFALHLATMDRVPVGQRVLLAGTGPFLLPVARALLEVGARVVGVVEANRPYRPTARAAAALRHPARLGELAGYAAALTRHRVPLWQGTHVVSATGRDRVRQVTLAGRHTDTVEVDALCVGHGFRPNAELARLLGCETRQDPDTGELFPVVDAVGRTSRPQVYAVGETAGIAGVHAARTRGRAAAMDILTRSGRPVPAGRQRRVQAQAVRLARFAALTDALYPPPLRLLTGLPDETEVCRCEQVTAGEIRATARSQANGLNATKGFTRAGMGLCQGRECGTAVACLARAVNPYAPAEVFTARMPVRPVPLAAVDAVPADPCGVPADAGTASDGEVRR